jgi:hypothetical protein
VFTDYVSIAAEGGARVGKQRRKYRSPTSYSRR